MTNTAADIVAYYEECERDYRLVWNLRRSLALHYGHWDETTHTLGQALARQNELLAGAAGVTAHDRVLDAGCGVGGSAIFLAQTRGARVTGITLRRRQAASASRHAEQRGVGRRTTFAVMDYLRTGLGARTFDVVWALESLCYAGDTAAFAREAFRLLRPGGRLVVADAFAAHPQATLLQDWLDCWAVDRLDTVDGFLEKLTTTGFTHPTWTDVTVNVQPSSRRLYFWSLATLPLGRIAERLRLRSHVQTRNILGCRLQYPAFRDGLVRYALVTATAPR
jgi:tocopherol O-methyltransferase